MSAPDVKVNVKDNKPPGVCSSPTQYIFFAVNAIVLLALVAVVGVFVNNAQVMSNADKVDALSKKVDAAPAAVVHVDHASHGWGYSEHATGPMMWGAMKGDDGKLMYPDCNLNEQSPIDIPMSGITPSTDTVGAHKTAGGAGAFSVAQSHGAPKYSCKEEGTCGSMSYAGKSYKLVQAHFHAPSENTLGGKLYPLEMHMVHQATDGSYAVLGVMYEVGDAAADSQIPTMFAKMDSAAGITEDVTFAKMYNADSGFYAWDGSFTTPPCTEGVQWVLQSEPTMIAADHAAAFVKHIGGYPGNARPTQPLNGRSITTSDDPKKIGEVAPVAPTPTPAPMPTPDYTYGAEMEASPCNTDGKEAGEKLAVGPNVCHAKKPYHSDAAGTDNYFKNQDCMVDNVVAVLEQAGANVTKGYKGDIDASSRDPITAAYWEAGLCPVNVHWHLGTEHLSVGEYDEAGKGPSSGRRRDLLADDVREGFSCHLYDETKASHTTEYNWQHCEGMKVGQTYEVHWPHSAAGACGTPNQYQTPFYDGVFCTGGIISLDPLNTYMKIGVQSQVFTIVNDESYYYPNLISGMIVEGDMGADIAKYTGSTTGTSRDNEVCSKYTPITWQVDRKCHAISASSFDKMCADMKAMKDDMSGDLYAHGSRELVADHLAANNLQGRL